MKRIAFYLMAAIILMTGCKDKDVAVEKVTLNKQTLEITVDAKETLVATIVPGDATNKTLVWSSDKENIASVSQTGEVAGKAAGTATITVTAHNGEKATCAVTVKTATVAVTGVTLNETEIELLVGEKFDLVATVQPSTATNQNVTWSSDDTKIATVDNNGKVTAVSVGTTTVVVVTSEKGFTKECKVVVKSILDTGVSLNKTTLKLGVSEEFTLIATITPEDASDKTLKWTSVCDYDENYEHKEGDEKYEKVVSVDENGKLTANRRGTATITVTTATGKTATCAVTVVPMDQLIVAEKGTLQVRDKDNNLITVSSWESSNASAVTVDNNGRFVAVGLGKAIITAKSDAEETEFWFLVIKEGTDPNTFTCDTNADPDILKLFHGASSKKWTWNAKAEDPWKGVVFGNGGFGDNRDVEWWGQPINEIGVDYGEGAFMIFKSDGTFSATNTYGETETGTYCINMNEEVRHKGPQWTTYDGKDWNIGMLQVSKPIIKGIHFGGNNVNRFFVKNFFIMQLSADEMVISSSVEHLGWGNTWFWRFKVIDD